MPTETKDELLKSFHEQFAENQNHHQTVFIQFISAVFVVIVGYAIVYTNTSSNAEFFNSIKDKDQHLISYAIIHLIGSFFIAEIILTLLCSLTINIGYGFRRDQNVNYNIRKHYLENGLYDTIFGTKAFNPKSKKFLDYLPEFNSIFVNSIIVIQAFLVVSIFYSLTQFDKFNLDFSKHWFTHSLFILLILTPIVLSIILYNIYFKKYKKTVC